MRIPSTKILIDTHIAIWAVTGSPKLSTEMQGFLENSRHDVFVSTVSIWEIAIKFALGRQTGNAMPFSASIAVEEFDRAGFHSLGIQNAHIVALESLPSLHRDPFDRLLAAQAISEEMCLVTADKTLAAYSSQFILAEG